MSDGDDPQLQLARQRTDAAIERTALAVERTYSAWVRTGIAAIAAGFGIAELLTSLEPRWAFRLLGAVFIVSGIMTLTVAHLAYRRALRRHERLSRVRIRAWVAGALVIALVLASTAGLVLALLN